MTQRAVVIGAGAGGLTAANRLARHRRDGADIEVTLIERTGEHLFLPGLVAVLFGEAEAARFRRPVGDVVAPDVEVVVGEVTDLRLDESEVTGSFGTLSYDQLVLAAGADVGWPGSSPACGELSPWTLPGALAGREAVERVGPGARVVVGVTGLAYRCPPAVFDLAVRLRRRTGASVEVVHPWARPLAPFGEGPAGAFETMLDEAGVAFRGGFELADVTGEELVAGSGDAVGYDVAFVVPPHRPSPLVASWPQVAYPTLTHPGHANVAVIGDLAAPGLRVGMAGTLAVFEAAHVADRIAAGAAGRSGPTRPTMAALCFVDTGETGSLLSCDFTAPAAGDGPPACTLLPFMPWFRPAKSLFAEEWFTSTIDGRVR